MVRRPAPSAVTLLGLGLVGAACARTNEAPGAAASPTTSPTTSVAPAPSTEQSPTPSTAAPQPPTTTSNPPATVYGPVWPLDARTLAATPPAQAPALTAIRTARHATYDRLVFDFTGRFGQVRVRYVPVVHADPSDRPVALRGKAFLEVTVHDAYAAWGGRRPSYAGPRTVTPGYPTLKQVTVSGDFENVLSFGVGVDRIAGFTLMRAGSPNRLVLDLAHRPAWPMWPDNSLAQAQQVQAAFEAGHVPWRTSVVGYFARLVYGWTDPAVTRIPGTDEYWVSARGSTERVRIRQVFPFQGTHRVSIAEIAGVR
jgi:hypothetical protein